MKYRIYPDGFTYSTPEDAKKICKLLNCQYKGKSRIDGYGMAKLQKDNNKWYFYKKYLNCELVSMLVDNLHPNPPIIPDDIFLIKFKEHKPEIFTFRKLKFERILIDKLDKQNNRFLYK